MASQSLEHQYIFVSINAVGGNIIAGNNLIASFYVPINVNSGELISYFPTSPYMQIVKTGNNLFQTVKISLMDDFGNLLDINNSDWSFVLKLIYE